MDVVYSPSQTLHHALELDGGQLVLSWESPIRAVRVAERLAEAHSLLEPDPLDRELIEQVHDADYIEFLTGCWDRWVAEGRGATQAMGFAWPSAGFRNVRPDDLDGQLGYYSFAADCSIGPALTPGPPPVGARWRSRCVDRRVTTPRRASSAIIAISAGVDTFEDDPISTFQLPTAVFPTIGSCLASLDLPTVLVLEGGYATDALADNVAGLLRGFDSFV